ncbi:MAG: glycogen debranching protein GlgX [Halieaceae bacterium]|nr:glycogen debranching protein GlgX [Halieaceae bacterium]
MLLALGEGVHYAHFHASIPEEVPLKLVPGEAEPLGATPTAEGVNFALYSAHAEAVELCLFDPEGKREVRRLFLPARNGDVWHGFLPGAAPGLCYGYRVHGPYAPGLGHRFNPNKLLLDPYARAVYGELHEHPAIYGFTPGGDEGLADARDSAPYVPKGVVCAPLDCAPPGPARSWAETVIYEMHLKGFTMRHPALSEADRGRITGLSSDAVLAYLRALGVTAIELLPVHAFVSESFLHERGLVNYWGYNTLNFFSPHGPYVGNAGAGAGAAADEPRLLLQQAARGGEVFRGVVERLHEHGIEVILDVVYNHSAEGGRHGPTLSLRGIDNASYYRLEFGQPARYVNDTGCGNTLACEHPAVRRMILDSLRYWSDNIGVDGFRFDLATTLARSAHGFDRHAGLLAQIGADSRLARCKLIAEPWDVGPGGYRLGGFPQGWSEWNDRYRDSVRRFWRGDDGEAPELATRFAGSGDFFEATRRNVHASINFISSHDGFSLRDLVSYSRRHNRDNGEGNRDGHAENFSDNCGVEGTTEDAVIVARRRQRERTIMATLLLSQGVPMLQAGDELGRSQGGNNNAYCQDNAISWIDWENTDSELLTFVTALLRLRAEEPLLHADRYRHVDADDDGQSMHWLAPEGGELKGKAWHEPDRDCVACLLQQAGSVTVGQRSLLVVMNAGESDVDFCLPLRSAWRLRVDTAVAPWCRERLEGTRLVGPTLSIAAHSLQLLEYDGAPDDGAPEAQ